jgi:aspartate carbamoyltransferase catalytic subunit
VEIAAQVADSPRSTIVEQVANGVSVRMAVLYLLLGGAVGAGDAGDGNGRPAEHPAERPAEVA